MSLTSYAYSLFLPSIGILAVGILVLIAAWLSDKVGSRQERAVMDHWRRAMAKSVHPPALDYIPIDVIADDRPTIPTELTASMLPPPPLLPIPCPPPLSKPLPLRAPRRLRTRPPPLPKERRSEDEPEESSITGRYSPSDFANLIRRSGA